MRARELETQECVPVGNIPSAAVAISGVEGGECPVGCLPKRCLPEGVGVWPVEYLPTDRHLWKQYLSATTVADGKNYFISHCIAWTHCDQEIRKQVFSCGTFLFKYLPLSLTISWFNRFSFMIINSLYTSSRVTIVQSYSQSNIAVFKFMGVIHCHMQGCVPHGRVQCNFSSAWIQLLTNLSFFQNKSFNRKIHLLVNNE